MLTTITPVSDNSIATMLQLVDGNKRQENGSTTFVTRIRISLSCMTLAFLRVLNSVIYTKRTLASFTNV